MLPVLILVGLRFGAFTPTEAGAVAAAYAVFVGMVVYRELHWRDLGPIVAESLAATAVVMLILATANALMWALTWERVPMKMAQALFALSDNPYVLLLLINVLLLFLGCVMEGTALLIILTPDPGPGHRQARHRSGPLRPRHRPQPHDRRGHAARGHDPLHRLLDRRRVGRGVDPGALAVPDGPGGRPLRRHLRAADRPLAAQPRDGNVGVLALVALKVYCRSDSPTQTLHWDRRNTLHLCASEDSLRESPSHSSVT